MALFADLVAQTLGSNHCDFIANALVGLEIESELRVVTLDDDLGGLLHGLGANATHFGGIGRTWSLGEKKSWRWCPFVDVGEVAAGWFPKIDGLAVGTRGCESQIRACWGPH